MNSPKKFVVIVDGEKFEWDKQTITGAELRALAGIPDGAEIFLHVPGHPDLPVQNSTSIDLSEHHGPAKFSTQSSGSQAG